nr:KH domain-containing, RNA-binding, signal transduction-associated protein 1-like [Dermatophagoides farinae]
MAHNNGVHFDDSDTSTNDSQTTTAATAANCNGFSNSKQKIQRNLPIITLDVHKGEPIRLQVKVMVPIDDHPNYNFVGKLLGPKGNSLKWLQEQTQTKMAILGRGSMKNKQKEKELRETNDPKYSHLNENLHVEITAIATAPEAYQRISQALVEIKRFLVPDYFDDIRQQQLRELGVIHDDDSNHHHHCLRHQNSQTLKSAQIKMDSTNTSSTSLSLLCNHHHHDDKIDAITIIDNDKLHHRNQLFTNCNKNDIKIKELVDKSCSTSSSILSSTTIHNQNHHHKQQLYPTI